MNGVARAPGSVATGTLSALCFALVLAAAAGAAYYCVKRRRREEQFGYFQVCAACGGGGLSGAKVGAGCLGEPRGALAAGAGAVATRGCRGSSGGSSGGGGMMDPGEPRGEAPPTPGAPPILRLLFQADLREEEEEEEAPQQERGAPRAARLRPQRPLVAIPNPLYGGHAPDYEPLQVRPAPPPRPSPPSPRPAPALTPSLPQDALLADADHRRSPP